MDKTHIHHIVMKLTDGSEVHDLHVRQGRAQVRFYCVTQEDAIALSQKLAAAFREHTNERIEVTSPFYLETT